MTGKTLDELFNEEAAKSDTPEARAEFDAAVKRISEKARADREKMIATGQLQPDGEPWPTDDEEEEEEEDEE